MPPRALAQRLAVLPQTPEIAWAVDARTLVGLGRIPFLGARGGGTADAAAVAQAMELAGVSDFAGRVVTSLSGGERARVLIARALAGEPEWLLADEPLSGVSFTDVGATDATGPARLREWAHGRWHQPWSKRETCAS